MVEGSAERTGIVALVLVDRPQVAVHHTGRTGAVRRLVSRVEHIGLGQRLKLFVGLVRDPDMPAPEGLGPRIVAGEKSDHGIAPERDGPGRGREPDHAALARNAAGLDQVGIALPEQAGMASRKRRAERTPLETLYGLAQSVGDHAVSGHRSVERILLRGTADHIAVGRLSAGAQRNPGLGSGSVGHLLPDDLHLAGQNVDPRFCVSRRKAVGWTVVASVA